MCSQCLSAGLWVDASLAAMIGPEKGECGAGASNTEGCPHPVGPHFLHVLRPSLSLTGDGQGGPVPVHESGTHKREVICCEHWLCSFQSTCPKFTSLGRLFGQPVSSKARRGLFSSVSQSTCIHHESAHFLALPFAVIMRWLDFKAISYSRPTPALRRRN